MTKDQFIMIALDGGAGTGKSTTAHFLSKALNLLHVDTGSHYRAVTRSFINSGIKPAEVNQYLIKNKFSLSSEIKERKSHLLVDQKNFEKSELRSSEINAKVSDFSSLESVRSLLFDYQRSQVEFAKINKFNGIVMEGRDIGTIILPDAHLKIFLEADASVRSTRRNKDGESDQIVNRDEKDSSRKIAPLSPASDSVLIDTGKRDIDEVMKLIMGLIRKIQ